MKNLFSIEGRATRKEYWGITILSFVGGMLIYFLIMVMIVKVFGLTGKNLNPFKVLMLPLFLLKLALNIRRLHDIGFSGWHLLIGFIPFLGPIILFVMMGFIPGEKGKNKYGENPRNKEEKEEKLTPPPIESIKNE